MGSAKIALIDWPPLSPMILDFLTLDHIEDDGKHVLTRNEAQRCLNEDPTLSCRTTGPVNSGQSYFVLHNTYKSRTVEKKRGFFLYAAIKRLGYDYRPKNLQVLCFNCQWGKQIQNGFCPHHPTVDLRRSSCAESARVKEEQ